MVLVAGLHGDETVGVVALQEIVAMARTTPPRGLLRVILAANPAGLVSQCRGITPEGPDLNRLFPGIPTGSAGERLAASLWARLLDPRPDLVVDLHADSPAGWPHAILDRTPRLSGQTRTDMHRQLLRAARASGLGATWDHGEEAWQGLRLDRTLTGALVNIARVPALTLEVGSRRLNTVEAVHSAVRAVRGILAEWGLSSATAAPPAPPWAGVLQREEGPIVHTEGLLVHTVLPGARLKSREPLAEVRDLEGQVLERIVAPSAAVVLSLAERSWVRPGNSTCALGILP